MNYALCPADHVDILYSMDITETTAAIHNGSRRLITRTETSIVALLTANLGILFFYFAYDFSLFQLAIVYWWECLWIGLFCALKLITASIFGDPYENKYIEFSRGSNVFVSIAAIAFLSTEFLAIFGALGIAILFAFKTLSPTDDVALLMDGLTALIVCSSLFLIGHGVSFAVNFVFLREYKHVRVGALLALPFKRCFALIGTIAIAFVAVYWIPAFANSTGFAIALITVKLLWDYRLHRKERRAFHPQR